MGDACPAGSFLAGFFGRAGALIDNIGILCTRFDGTQFVGLGDAPSEIYGKTNGAGPLFGLTACPQGMAVDYVVWNMALGDSSGSVDNIVFGCKGPNGERGPQFQIYSDEPDGFDIQSTDRYQANCTGPTNFATGITVSASANKGVEGLDITCGQIQKGTPPVAAAPAPPPATPPKFGSLKNTANVGVAAGLVGSSSSNDQIQLSWAASGFGLALGIDDPRELTTPTSQGIAIIKSADGPCDGPPVSVDFVCKYTVTLINTDPSNTFAKPLAIQDQTSFSKVTLDSKEPGWNCQSPGSSVLQCSMASPSIAPGQPLQVHVTLTVTQADVASAPCAMPNSASLIDPPGATTATVTAVLPGTSGCGALTGKIEIPGAATRPICRPGWMPVAVVARLPKGWRTERVGSGKQSITCGKPPSLLSPSQIIKLLPAAKPKAKTKTIILPKLLACGAGTVRVGNSCVPACPDGKTPKPKFGACAGAAQPKIDLGRLTCPGGGFHLIGQPCPTQLPKVATPPLGGTELCPNGQRKVNAVCPGTVVKPNLFKGTGKYKLLQPDVQPSVVR